MSSAEASSPTTCILVFWLKLELPASRRSSCLISPLCAPLGAPPAATIHALRSSEPGSSASGSASFARCFRATCLPIGECSRCTFGFSRWRLMTRSLLILDQFNQLGGAQRCLLDLLPAFLEAGFVTHIAVPGDGPLADGARSLGAEVHRIPCGAYTSGAKSWMDAARFAADLPRQ